MSGSRIVQWVLLLVAIALLGTILWPLASPLFLAAVLAAALHPWQRRLARRLRDHPRVAAAVLTVGVLVAGLLPVAGIGAIAVREIADGVAFVRGVVTSEGLHGLAEKLPGPLKAPGHRAAAAVERAAGDGSGFVGGQLATAADAVRGAVARTSRAVLNTVFMLIALFFFLVDGRRLLRWLEEVSPLERGKFQEIALEVRQAVVSVLLSTLVTAAIQAAFALAAYLIARVPQPFFFGLVTFLFALVPVIGAASITVAVAVLMLATGHTGAAIFLFVWGLAVVGLVDNLVKPWLIKDRVRLHGAVVFFALMGGLLMFGVKGLIAGPLIVAFFVAVLRVFSRPDSRLTYPSASPGDVDVAPSPAG